MTDQIYPPGSPEPNFTATTSVEDLLRLSSSFDGFKRENAVRRLGLIGDPVAIPALIVRANDWVPEVRAAAYGALVKMLTPANAVAFVSSLPQLLHLQKCTRGDHSSLLQAVQEFLVRDGNVEALHASWQSENVPVARLVTRLLIAKQALPASQIIRHGLAHEDVVIRAIAIDLLRDLEDDDFEQALAKALNDRYMPVRREAFQQLMRRAPERGLVAARSFLFDPSAAMRELALRHLLAAGESAEAIYFHEFTENFDRVSVVRCVLWGWSALNCRSRLGQVEQLLSSPSPTVRRAALQAIIKLSPEQAPRHLEAALADPAPSTSKEAARWIRKLGLSLDVDTLIAIARSRNEVHVTHACYYAARGGSKWDWLKFVLSVYPAPNSGVPREELHSEIVLWQRHFNRSGAQLDRRTRDELGALIGACRSQLERAQFELLEFTWRTS
jgi:HEAT repeat protein